MAGRPEKIETPLGQRLRDIRSALGDPNRDEFASQLGIKPSTYSGYERGTSKPTTDALAALRQKHSVDLNWVATGEGNMFDTQQAVSVGTGLHVPSSFSYIPRYDVRASAGNGMLAISEETVGQMAFNQGWLTEVGLDPQNAGVVLATGDSMYPTISSGTPMVVDFRQVEPTNGRIYVINVGGDLLVKRVERTIDDRITLISDNPLYERRTINLNEFTDMKIIGAVRFILKDM